MMMLDYHNHLEKGSLDRSWLEQFLPQAAARGVTEYGIAEHSYLFAELLPLYEGKIGSDKTPLGRRQHEWFFAKAGKWRLEDYFNLLLPLRREGKVKIGLELDWFPGNAQLVQELLGPWPWDYIIGSVHWLDGWVYDVWPDTWQGRDVQAVWHRYIDILRDGVQSRCFDILGHADAIKVYGFCPQPWPEQGWIRLARVLAENGVAAEVNTAFRYRGYSPNFCPDPQLLDIFCREGVELTFGSDAHYPEHAGMYQAEAWDYARQCGYSHCLSFTLRRPQRQPLHE
jgi:histidinol-phosphatase (PHP family)